MENRLFAHHERLGTAVAPLVETTEAEFWDAARAQLTSDQARTLVEEQFAFTAPLREHRDAFVLATAVDPEELLGGLGGLLAPSIIEIEYTDEAIRAMQRAEQSVTVDAKREFDRRFDGQR